MHQRTVFFVKYLLLCTYNTFRRVLSRLLPVLRLNVQRTSSVGHAVDYSSIPSKWLLKGDRNVCASLCKFSSRTAHYCCCSTRLSLVAVAGHKMGYVFCRPTEGLLTDVCRWYIQNSADSREQQLALKLLLLYRRYTSTARVRWPFVGLKQQPTQRDEGSRKDQRVANYLPRASKYKYI